MILEEPTPEGRFGEFGGRYVPETLVPACQELELAFRDAWADQGYRSELDGLLADYAGRPSPLTECPNLSAELGCRLLLKREDLNHTGSHKINNCVGQVLLARRLGKTRIIAETGAGQHGVATATVCAYFGLPCTVYMGAKDVQRQALNVFRMRLSGAEVRGVEAGQRTLKEAINEAMRDWVTNVRSTHYVLGSALGSHPYPRMVRDFHSVIGRETKEQILEAEGRLPDEMIACVGGGSNAIGFFFDFLEEEEVGLVGVEGVGVGDFRQQRFQGL